MYGSVHVLSMCWPLVVSCDDWMGGLILCVGDLVVAGCCWLLAAACWLLAGCGQCFWLLFAVGCWLLKIWLGLSCC